MLNYNGIGGNPGICKVKILLNFESSYSDGQSATAFDLMGEILLS